MSSTNLSDPCSCYFHSIPSYPSLVLILSLVSSVVFSPCLHLVPPQVCSLCFSSSLFPLFPLISASLSLLLSFLTTSPLLFSPLFSPVLVLSLICLSFFPHPTSSHFISLLVYFHLYFLFSLISVLVFLSHFLVSPFLSFHLSSHFPPLFCPPLHHILSLHTSPFFCLFLTLCFVSLSCLSISPNLM